MPEARVFAGDEASPLTIRINGPKPTFRLETNAIRAAAMSELDDRTVDFLEIASTVFAADSGVGRGGKSRSEMGEAWRRAFRFHIPVRDIAFWSRSDVLETLCEATGFLTEDQVQFDFTPMATVAPLQPFLDLRPNERSFHADEVILFSGGLDSFAGALESLATTSRKVVLVTHRSAPKTIARQVRLGKILSDRFPDRVLHVHVLARRVGQEATDATQRSRSLLFTALGHAIAMTFGAEKLSFYENGIVSQNLPISRQIVGTMATRTTHPLSLMLLNRLIGLGWPAAARISNRFQWLTKTDVVRRIHDHGEAGKIPMAVSCTSIRDQTRRFTHCGACTQCLDRRFAILAAGLGAFDKPEDYKTDILIGERGTTISRAIALEWTQHSLRMGGMDKSKAMASFGLELGRIIRGHGDLNAADVLERTLEMQRRHSGAVRKVLAEALANHAVDMAGHTLPASCLLVMHAGQTRIGEAGSEVRSGGGAAHWLTADESDAAPDATMPLKVAFEREHDLFAISAIGLGRVNGMPAMVAHGLKPFFDADIAEGRLPEHHRYHSPSEAAECKDMSKATFRANVRRCRSALASFFQEIHGYPPPDHLLIQNRRSAGYRLDPATQIVAPAVGVESPGRRRS